MVTTDASVRGRPRDPQISSSIMAAARGLLVRDGYERLTVESVAQEANVSRPTVYRRWPSKAHLVFDAIFDAVEAAGGPAPVGEFEVDLRRFIGFMLEFRLQPGVAEATMGILAEGDRSPDGQLDTEQLLVKRSRDVFDAIIRSGVDQGEVGADIDVDMAYSAVMGTSIYIVHVQQLDDIDAMVDGICSMLLYGMATPTMTAPKTVT